MDESEIYETFNVAVKNLNYKLAQEMIDKGVENYTYGGQYGKGVALDGALLQSARNGHAEMVKFILDRGVNINYDRDYVLELAVRKCHLDVVRLLLDRGADVFANNGYILVNAAENGNVEVMGLLLNKVADTHARKDEALRRPLINAAMNGHLEVVKLLVEKIGKINAYNNRFFLRLAAENGHLEVVKFLVENGAKINAYNNYVLRCLAKFCNLKMVEVILIDYNVKISNKTMDEFKNNHPNVYELILKRDLNESLKEKLKSSPDKQKIKTRTMKI